MMSQKNKCTALPGLALAWALACHVPASHAERADRDQPVHLEAAQVSIDDASQISTFTGNVQLIQGTMTIRGDKIVVRQDKDGLRRGTATGQPASFRQKREGFDEYMEGYGERIEYDSVNATVNLFGQAHIKRGHDEVRGEHISYNSRTEIFQAQGTPDQGRGSTGKGRVRAIIQPKGDPVPATPVDKNPPIQPATPPTPPENEP